jgi:hypothetical protein
MVIKRVAVIGPGPEYLGNESFQQTGQMIRFLEKSRMLRPRPIRPKRPKATVPFRKGLEMASIYAP